MGSGFKTIIATHETDLLLWALLIHKSVQKIDIVEEKRLCLFFCFMNCSG